MRDRLFDQFSEKTKDRFRVYHIDNPHVYQEFCKRAAMMLKTGRKKYSARTIFEVMRWDWDLKTTHEDFKISNDFIPIYVRMLIYHHPEYEQFFDLKGVEK